MVPDDPAGAIEWPLGSYFQILHLKQLSEDCTASGYGTDLGYGTGRYVFRIYIYLYIYGLAADRRKW